MTTMDADEAKYLAKTYRQMNQREHILKVQDTYVGSIEATLRAMLVRDRESGRLVPRAISLTPALHKIVDETLMNARDHAYRMMARLAQQGLDAAKEKPRRVDDVRLDVDARSGTVTVTNDGDGVDVALHPEHNVWIPEMVFTNPLASSNFDKGEDDVVAGRNGYGAKCTIIWSAWARLETVDISRGLRYVQIFEQNLEIIHPAQVSKLTKAEKARGPYTSLSFRPDFERLGQRPAADGTVLSDDFVDLLHKRAIDVACTSPLSYTVGGKRALRVWFNGAEVQQRSFREYVQLALPDGVHFEFERANDRWEFAVVLRKDMEALFGAAVGDAPEPWRHVSFVNGVCTYAGGSHVEYITKQIVDFLIALFEKKHKIKVSAESIRKHLVLFLRCDVVNPAFTDQSKSALATKFGAKGLNPCVVSELFLKRVAAMQNGYIGERVSAHRAEQQDRAASAAAAAGTRRGSIVSDVSMFDDAAYARCPSMARGRSIILNLVEGDSARAGAMSGEMDMNFNGLLGMRGKIGNVRDRPKSFYQKEKSFVFILMRVMGLKFGQTFASMEEVRKQLRYNEIRVLCDQDHDGSHIKGLLVNTLAVLWPSLLRVPGFLWFWSTPIVIVRVPNRDPVFWYSLAEYNRWAQENPALAAKHSKYYKGLGSSTKKEWLVYVADPKRSAMVFGEQSEAKLDMVFGSRPEARREWLAANLGSARPLDLDAPTVTVEEFIDNEMILFSAADNVRSIPSVMDGLKPSQRKVLFGCFRRNLVEEIKVATVAGYFMEHTEYHHGEASLQNTIIGMAQNFTGSNNVNLLVPEGQFGTRLEGGRDAASARYIFTRLSPLARLLFHPRDDAVIPQLVEEGKRIEPAFYYPVICMLLVNGASGIGTGWSTDVAPRDPLQVLQYHRLRLLGREADARALDLRPFFEGHLGEVLALPRGEAVSYRSRGVWRRAGPEEVLVTELPVGEWTAAVKKRYEAMVGEPAADAGPAKKRARAGDADSVGTGEARRPKEERRREPPKLLKDVFFQGTDSVVRVRLVFHSQAQLDALLADEPQFEKTFCLVSFVPDILTAFRADGSIRIYESAHAILEEFHQPRLELYGARKEHMIAELEVEAAVAENRARFIRAVRSGDLALSACAGTGAARALLAERGFFRKPADRSDFEYLLSMRIDAQTEKRAREVAEEHQAKLREIEALRAMTPEELWLADLDLLEPALRENRRERLAASAPSADREEAPAAGKKRRAPGAAKDGAAAKKKKPRAETN